MRRSLCTRRGSHQCHYVMYLHSICTQGPPHLYKERFPPMPLCYVPALHMYTGTSSSVQGEAPTNAIMLCTCTPYVHRDPLICTRRGSHQCHYVLYLHSI